MVTKIDLVGWGKVIVNGKEYHQVLISQNQVFERKVDQLYQQFGTTHQIANWEEEILLEGDPEIILIANGFDGVLKVKEDFKNKVQAFGYQLKVLKTPEAVGEYNRLVAEGKQVNALVHTTC